MKAYTIRYTSTPLHGPEWLIKVPRLVNQHNQGFRAIHEGDLRLFRSAIANGKCTPYDINEEGGSMLQEIVPVQRIDMMAHLVGMGVDLCQPVGIDTLLLSNLWMWLVESTANPQDHELLPKLIPSFPFDEYSEKENFTLLHEIVCYFNGHDLDSALQSHSADVNELNERGEIALEMAVNLNNIAAVRTLLRHGADPNINDGTPIYLALSYQNLVAVDLLLRSGAVVHGPAGNKAANEWIQGYTENDAMGLTIDRLLIEYGIDVNRQVSGTTKLIALCQEPFRSSKNIEQLIDLGADLESRDTQGYTALQWAVCANILTAIETLLHSGARIDVKTNEGNTVAHLAVICSRKIEMTKVMSEMFGRLDLNLKNEDGQTVFELLKKRNGLGWEAYYSEWRERNFKGHGDPYCQRHWSRAWENEYEVILALEALLHHIQDLQGVPKDQQYPPIGEYLSDDKDEDSVPGAWPV